VHVYWFTRISLIRIEKESITFVTKNDGHLYFRRMMFFIQANCFTQHLN
jgi:hypothetical protein